LQGVDENICNSSKAAARNPKINDEASEKEQNGRLKLTIRSVIIKLNGKVRLSPKNLD